MLFSVPLFATNTYIDEQESHTVGLQIIIRYPNNSEGFNITYDNFIEKEKELNLPLVYIDVFDRIYQDSETDYLDLRANEADFAFPYPDDEDNYAVYDLRNKT